MGGVEHAWDSVCFRMLGKSVNPRDRFLKCAELAPWRESDSLDFVHAEEREEVIAKADEACRHEFDLLGSGCCHLGEEIDWSLDFKSGYHWATSVPAARMKWGDAPAGTDIKVPWELSRCMHFATFGLADRLSGDSKYYEEFKRQVRHWIEANPVGRGVNWLCPMDVALRAVNWINAVMLFQRRIVDDPDEGFFAEMEEALWVAGLHISRNLEWQGPNSDHRGNHFLSDLTGLLGVGLFFRDRRRGRRWFTFAKKWFEREIQHQVNADGSNFEASTNYHRLVMEMFLWVSALCRENGEPFSGAYEKQLRGMAGFVEAYTAPSGRAAQFGDNDSGRVLTCGITDLQDHRYLFAADLCPRGTIDRWLLGAAKSQAASGVTHDAAFPDGGFWFMRTEEAWMGVRAGQISHNGGHSHCDQLSIVLGVAKEDFIIDPGSAVYSADTKKRNRYRSAVSHNACRLNGWEPNSFGDGKPNLFLMGDDTKTEVVEWGDSEGVKLFEGRHRGYERFREGLIYGRSLAMGPEYLAITDRFEPLESGDQLDWTFYFPPQVQLVREGDSVVACSAGSRVRIVLDPRMELDLVEAHLSLSYGAESTGTALLLSVKNVQPSGGDYQIRFEWTAQN